MNQKVEELLRQASEKAQSEKRKEVNALLDKLNLYELEEVDGRKSHFDILEYKNGKPVYLKKKYIEISDEEYQELLKYYPIEAHIQQEPKPKISTEDNGEKFVMLIAKICLYLSIISAVILLLFTLIKGTGYGGLSVFIYAACLIICGLSLVVSFLGYYTVKIFTNISRKTSAIYQILEEKR